MLTNTARLERICEKKLQAGATLDDVIAYLHTQGTSILESIKVVRQVGHMSLGDAKQLVSCHTAWRSTVEANEALHEEAETAVRMEDKRT